MSKRIALVTGANKGLGFHVARQLAEAGLTVYLGARDAARGAAAVAGLAGLEVRAIAIDVTRADTLAAASAQLGSLDILINNAGIAGLAGLAPPSQTTLEVLREIYETNVFGVVATTNAFLPLLRKSPSPRIVNVSSGLGSISQMADPTWAFAAINAAAYQSSKSALNALTVMYAKELPGFRINAVSPGYRKTDLGPYNHTDPNAGDPAEGARGITRLALEDGATGTFVDEYGATYPW